MIDNCYKFYPSDKEMIDALSKHVVTEHTADVHKVLADAEISYRVTEAIGKSR